MEVSSGYWCRHCIHSWRVKMASLIMTQAGKKMRDKWLLNIRDRFLFFDTLHIHTQSFISLHLQWHFMITSWIFSHFMSSKWRDKFCNKVRNWICYRCSIFFIECVYMCCYSFKNHWYPSMWVRESINKNTLAQPWLINKTAVLKSILGIQVV